MSSSTPFSGPHTHTQQSVPKVMLSVLVALFPATVFGIYLFGWSALFLFLVTVFSALASEAICLWFANKPIKLFMMDGSALLTAWLLAMTLPPLAPWWIGVIGGSFAIMFGKHVFGGIGQNIFNPAMLARVVLLISFPLEMTTWSNPLPIGSPKAFSFFESLSITFGSNSIDLISSASVLGHVKTELSQGHLLSDILQQGYDTSAMAIGFSNGSMGETSALLILFGAVLLLSLRIINWHIPVAMIASTAILATLFNSIDPGLYPDASFHVLSGGLMLGAFFIATDPVTSPNSNKGRLIFGASCGTLIFIIRTWGGYPEGIAFAVILMNAVTPVIDHYIRPRIYGYKSKNIPLQYKADDFIDEEDLNNIETQSGDAN